MLNVYFVRWSVKKNGRPVGKMSGGSKSAVVFAVDKADAQAKVMAQEDVGPFTTCDYEFSQATDCVVGLGGFNSKETEPA
jgi:hypothetical protein